MHEKTGVMTERRIYPRIKASHSALYFTRVCPRPRVASTVDLSIGGTRIETLYNLFSGEDLEISIAIHPQVIQCKGRVVHIVNVGGGKPESWTRFQAGVRFEEMSKADQRYLKAYIAQLMNQSNLNSRQA